MTVNSVFSNPTSTMTTSTASADKTASAQRGLGALGAHDFLKLMTEQMKQQDPTDPVDNKQMLAQMAQFSALAGTSEMSGTLQAISNKLDVLISAQPAPATATPTTTPTAANTAS